MENIGARFDKYDDEYLKFDKIEEPLSARADLHAFLMLDGLQPGTGGIVSDSMHDEFILGIDCDLLNAVITDEQIRDLVRCGVSYSDEYDCLCMFS